MYASYSEMVQKKVNSSYLSTGNRGISFVLTFANFCKLIISQNVLILLRVNIHGGEKILLDQISFRSLHSTAPCPGYLIPTASLWI